MNGWKKSSKCGSSSCVEVVKLPSGERAVRDSKRPESLIVVGPEDWAVFVQGVKAGEFD